jgi:hypothetical protein
MTAAYIDSLGRCSKASIQRSIARVIHIILNRDLKRGEYTKSRESSGHDDEPVICKSGICTEEKNASCHGPNIYRLEIPTRGIKGEQ